MPHPSPVQVGKNGVPKIFVVAGMPRTATTFLYYQLQHHPQLYAPLRKEMNFFSVLYDRGFDWYLRFYSSMSKGQVGMDISPAYFLDVDSIPRIVEFNPDMKVILGIRDAGDWLLSFYEQMKTQRLFPPAFEDFFYPVKILRSGRTIDLDLRDNWLSRTVESFRKAFGKNLFLYRYEGFKKNPLVLLQNIEDFLGITPYFTAENYRNLIVNSSQRGNKKMISLILKNENVISLATRLMPEKMVRLFQKKRWERSFPRSETKRDEAQLKKAEDFFSGQQPYIENLFSLSDYVLGDGTLVAPVSSSRSEDRS